MRAALIGLVALVGSGPTLAQDTAGDPEAGHAVAGLCLSCHGMAGDTGNERTPRIGGQPAAYLAEQLRAYLSGERELPDANMSRVIRILTDEQIDDVAAWYASHTAVPVTPEGYSFAGAPDQCFGCHGANGLARAEDVPNLAGHGRVYLDAQMQAFRSGARESETMTPIAQRLSDEEMAEVVDWYASIGLEVSEP
jgi:cytochrome c553